MPLRVPIRDANRAHLERQAQGALTYIANVMRQARIRARAKVLLSESGVGRIVVAVQGPGRLEAELMLPPLFNRFVISVI